MLFLTFVSSVVLYVYLLIIIHVYIRFEPYCVNVVCVSNLSEFIVTVRLNKLLYWYIIANLRLEILINVLNIFYYDIEIKVLK